MKSYGATPRCSTTLPASSAWPRRQYRPRRSPAMTSLQAPVRSVLYFALSRKSVGGRSKEDEPLVGIGQVGSDCDRRGPWRDRAKVQNRKLQRFRTARADARKCKRDDIRSGHRSHLLKARPHRSVYELDRRWIAKRHVESEPKQKIERIAAIKQVRCVHCDVEGISWIAWPRRHIQAHRCGPKGAGRQRQAQHRNQVRGPHRRPIQA